jgi:hypothetical protein
MRAAAALFALLAAGCVTRPVNAKTDRADPTRDGAVLLIECDRARLVVPERLRDQLIGDLDDAQRVGVTVGGLIVLTREAPPVCEISGEDLSVVAEGGVRIRKGEGGYSVEEGPFQTIIYRNGKILRR